MLSQLGSSVFQKKGKTVNFFDIDFTKLTRSGLKNVKKIIRLILQLRNPG